MAALTAACGSLALVAACAAPARRIGPAMGTPPPVSVPEIRHVRVYVDSYIPYLYNGLSPRSCDERPELPAFVLAEPRLRIEVHMAARPPGTYLELRMRVANQYRADAEGIARCDQFTFVEAAKLSSFGERAGEGVYDMGEHEGVTEYVWRGEKWPCHVEIVVELRDRQTNQVLTARPAQRFSVGGDACR